ncbi:hypothetical protein GCM10010915_04650 [Microbacterium faecale]|uniref:Alpha/beta hydrolase n=1 Tax=Microbacterium faecale TaxID=1804630 RepID=A0A916Y223_9MICO|nr:alpha/beta hydrolase [Microbacterium faecale]GGD27658.1 hypothetical protein GCM10010915_04650 [Microbacterium faecale]
MTLAERMGYRLAHTLFHPPRKKHHRHPGDLGLPFTEEIVRTPDGINLHLWLIPGRAAGTGAGTAIVGHGIGLTKSASLRQARLLHGLGWNVLVFDHRNHGLSAPDPAREHLAERYSADITTGIDVARTTWPGARPLVVWGFSFSTFPTLHQLRHPTSPVDAILCDSGPGLDLDAMLRDFLTTGGVPVPAPIRAVLRRPDVVSAFARSAVTMLGTDWPPKRESSASGTTPMLYLIGADDTLVQPAQVRALASRYPHATVAEFPAAHLEGIKTAPAEYEAAVTAFLHALARPTE